MMPHDPADPAALGGPTGPGPGAGPVIARIGEVAVTSSIVHTPAGDIPLRGSTWLVTEQWLPEQKTPTWAIVLAIVLFCPLTVLSLLFLLIKNTVYHGTAQVTISNGAQQYVARIAVRDQAQLQQVHQQVNYARSLAAL
ncbi:MAG TPA: hypothetical protein VES42_18750 [Pilimelia sp.]|nr:hypothetical protein [Pilimelia sp.]